MATVGTFRVQKLFKTADGEEHKVYGWANNIGGLNGQFWLDRYYLNIQQLVWVTPTRVLLSGTIPSGEPVVMDITETTIDFTVFTGSALDSGGAIPYEEGVGLVRFVTM